MHQLRPFEGKKPDDGSRVNSAICIYSVFASVEIE